MPTLSLHQKKIRAEFLRKMQDIHAQVVMLMKQHNAHVHETKKKQIQTYIQTIT